MDSLICQVSMQILKMLKGRNVSDDIKKAELIKLKAQNVEGIILDLRNNGAGSLTEVVDIMGLFMNKWSCCSSKRRKR